MHLRAAAHISLLLLGLAPGVASATGPGSSMLSISCGIVTIDEFRGVNSTSYMDIPYAYSSAVFLSYRYFITSRFAIGAGIGADDVKGNLTEGNPNVSGWIRGTPGTYIRHAYTIAPEAFIKYLERGKIMLYGYAGIGYTISTVEKAYDTRAYASAYQNGVNPNPSSNSTQNPLYVNDNHINAQLTGLGIRIGKKIAWDIEVGFGYKGLINTGLSVKL